MPVTGIFGNDGFGDLNEDGVKMTNLAPGHAAVAMAKMVTENPGMSLAMLRGQMLHCL